MNPKGKKLLALFAHPDDAEIWAGGTIAKWADLGGEAKITCFSTEGVRKKEAKKGASILKASLSTINEKPLLSSKTLQSTNRIVREFDPNVVITHYYKDTHPEHRYVFEILNNAIIENKIKRGKPNLLLCANTYNNLGLNAAFEPNIYIDISKYIKKKNKAIYQHKSQPFQIWKDMAAQQSKFLGTRITGIQHAEGFLQVPILGKLANLSLF